MTEPTVDELGAAHFYLAQSLQQIGLCKKARDATQQALVDLATNISEKTKSPPAHNVFDKKDWVDLGEDVSAHCMSGTIMHEDGRICYYHDRLSSWVFDLKRGYTSNKCLREQHDRDWAFVVGYNVDPESLSILHIHRDGRECRSRKSLSWLFDFGRENPFLKLCLREHSDFGVD